MTIAFIIIIHLAFGGIGYAIGREVRVREFGRWTLKDRIIGLFFMAMPVINILYFGFASYYYCKNADWDKECKW
jgi:hypothetical protein